MEQSGPVILGLGEVEKDGFGLKIERWAMAFEHGFLRGPGPGFTIAPQGLLCAGHDTSRNPLQPSVLGLHKVDPS